VTPPKAAIRPADLQDADAIAMVHVASWRAAYRGLLPQHVLEGLSVQRRADGWREILRSGEDHTLVAVDSETGRVGGFVNVGPSRDEDAAPGVGELRAIYLLEEWWNTGTGLQLHDVGLQMLRGQFAEAILWVLDSNERARRFYARRGWRADGAAKKDDRGDVVLTEVRYRRPLTHDATFGHRS
jgi:GNAT superfamily N-acetyltransferase